MNILINGGLGFVGFNLYLYLYSLYGESANYYLNDAEYSLAKKQYSLNKQLAKKHNTTYITCLNSATTEMVSKYSKLTFNYIFNCSCINIHSVDGYSDSTLYGFSDTIKNIISLTSLNYLFFSSVSVFGEGPKYGIIEDSPKEPICRYGTSKLLEENLIKYYAKKQDKLNSTKIFRLTNVFGPRQQPDLIESNVVSKLIYDGLTKNTLVIHKPGTQTRSFLSINKLMHSYINAYLNNIGMFNNYIDFNITEHASIEIKNIAKLIQKRIKAKTKKYPKLIMGSERSLQISNRYVKTNRPVILKLEQEKDIKLEMQIDETIDYIMEKYL